MAAAGPFFSLIVPAQKSRPIFLKFVKMTDSQWIFKSKHYDTLGPETVEEIWSNCFEWLDSSDCWNMTFETLKAAV